MTNNNTAATQNTTTTNTAARTNQGERRLMWKRWKAALPGLMLVLWANAGALAATGGTANQGAVSNPTITLSAPANNTASLYPAAFTVQATVAYPGQQGAINGNQQGVSVEFLVNGTKFAETTSAPYQASFTPPQAGIYTLTAQIHYGNGSRTIPSNAVTVISDLPPVVGLTAPANHTVVTAPASFNLSATASAPIGTIAKVEFYNGATLIGTATAATAGAYSVTWANVPYGTYSLTAKATDNYGFSNTTAPITVISNQPPTVSLTGPAANTVFTAPASITISANAADVDGTIAKVEFYASSTDANGTTSNALLGTATNAPYRFDWASVPVGKYTLTAQATDNYGAATTSAPVSITVKPGELLPYYIHTDQLDTPRMITDTAGNVVWRWDNTDPFGNNAANENPAGQGQFSFPLRFAGQYYDRETNLHYNINRDYDPSIGRYVQSDPIGLDGGINTYAYVGGNPISRVDPLGLYDLNFATGFHLPVSPGVAVGPVASSSIVNYSQNPNGPLVSNPIGTDVALGVIADVGVNVGISDISGTGGKCAGTTVNLGAGRYSGAQITFRNSQDQSLSIFNPARYIDAVSIGLGIGIATPVSVSRGF
jgi:RHS repeat-associated protein